MVRLVWSLAFLDRGPYLLRMGGLRTHALWNHCSSEKERINVKSFRCYQDIKTQTRAWEATLEATGSWAEDFRTLFQR